MVEDFVAERYWKQFHTPKNLAISIAIEAAELMEIFQWSEENDLSAALYARVEEELADVIIYSLALANATGMDLSGAVRKKNKKNALKYPVDKYLGRYK
ncbi:MAG: nucleotide pyrophosphohydrolase [Desulfotomaculaceae bacterium]|nr:nucleotide pyrophosphohydrolase [Desulfotomaculaceae bacterium]